MAERLLDGDPVRPVVGEEVRKHGWDELHDAYAAQLDVTGGGWPEGAAEGR